LGAKKSHKWYTKKNLCASVNVKYHCGMMGRDYHVIGLMSGTSCDGLDLAYCRIKWEGMHWSYEIIEAETLTYSEGQKKVLHDLTQMSAVSLIAEDRRWGTWMGEQVAFWIKNHPQSQVDFIASHGHTVFHQPDNGFTFQMGSPAHLAVAAQLPVIGDFRSTDVAYGGQGAPLVPIGDQLLFGEYAFCLNLGGFANISYEIAGERLAFDICPLNLPLNLLANRLGMEWDANGEHARMGNCHPELLKELNAITYYQEPPPKSLGKEWMEETYIPILKKYAIPVIDLMATVTEHAAIQIAQCVLGWTGSVLVTGGGAYHLFLLERLRHHAPHMEWVVPESKLVNFKEALIFALLGVLRWEMQVNALSSVTGAARSSTGGGVFYY
jgi:anhydro-N-acetylmuramic acid kinase